MCCKIAEVIFTGATVGSIGNVHRPPIAGHTGGKEPVEVGIFLLLVRASQF